MEFESELIKQRCQNFFIAGERESGKTTMTLHIAKQLCNNDIVKSIVVITNKPEEYQNLANTHIYSEYNDTYLDVLLKSQKQKHRELTNQHDAVLFILDYPIDISELNNNKLFRMLIHNPNGFRISTIVVTTQYYFNFKPNIRSCFDYMLQFQNKTLNDNTIAKEFIEHCDYIHGDYDDVYNTVMRLNKYDALCLIHCKKEIMPTQIIYKVNLIF